MMRRARISRLRTGLTALGAVLALGLATPALSHDFWIQPQTFKVAPKTKTPMTLQVGHGGDRQKSLIAASRVLQFYALTRAGKVDLKDELRLGDPNRDTVLGWTTPGLNVLALETNGAFSELPPVRFNDYLKAEGLTPALTHREVTKKSDTPGRETYSRRAKALVQVGAYSAADDAVATKPLGLTLELVPEVNPYAPGYVGKLPVRVYYLGKPLAGATVMLNNLDFDSKPVAKVISDASGRVVLDVPKQGSWQVNVIWTRPVNDPKFEFDTVFSSLTLGFK